MDILLLHQHYFPEMSGTARRAKELAESFANRGHKVIVITSFPRKYRSIPGEDYKYMEVLNGVMIHRINNLIEVKKNVILRLISYFSFVLFSIQLGLKCTKKVDIIISIAPLSSGIVGSLLKSISAKHHHFDIPDILPDLGISAGMIKNKFLIYWLRKLEKWVYNHSDSISTCTEGQMKNIIQKGVLKEKLCCIPDWVDDSFFKMNLKIYFSELSKFYSYPGKKIISFVGNIGALQKPDTFVEVMELLKRDGLDEFIFLFIGDGIMLPQVKEMVELKKLNNIKFIGRIKREHIPALMKISDILVTNYLADDHLALYIPGKLFEYAISKKPIIIGAKGDAKKFVEKYNLGLAVTPSNKEKFKEAIIKVSSNDYIYNPKINQFTHDYSLGKVTKLYNQIFDRLDSLK